MVNCHNLGKITYGGSTTYIGALAYSIDGSTWTDCYYLSGTCSKGIGAQINSASTVTNCIKKDTITGQDLYEWLSASSDNWKIDLNKNDGYPILKWQ